MDQEIYWSRRYKHVPKSFYVNQPKVVACAHLFELFDDCMSESIIFLFLTWSYFVILLYHLDINTSSLQVPSFNNRSIWSWIAGLRMVHQVSKSIMGGRA